MDPKLAKTRELIALVLANRADEAIALMEHDEFDKSILTDMRWMPEFDPTPQSSFEQIESPLGLYQITQANKIYYADKDWKDSAMPKVIRHRLEIEKLENYWEKLGYPVREPIDFGKFRNLCAHFYDDCTMEYLLDGSEEQLVNLGYDLNEIRMCYALLTYDKDEIEHQIALGTNPNVPITGEYPPPANKDEDMIGLTTAYHLISNAVVIYALDLYWNSQPGTVLPRVNWEDLHGLFCAAAYTELVPRLEKLVP